MEWRFGNTTNKNLKETETTQVDKGKMWFFWEDSKISEILLIFQDKGIYIYIFMSLFECPESSMINISYIWFALKLEYVVSEIDMGLNKKAFGIFPFFLWFHLMKDNPQLI